MSLNVLVLALVLAMHPFGGTPICAKCSTAVYAAEQIIGPGRKLYHKACLTCTSCNKRLDSYNLVEHDEQPYCKTCHIKLFGTRDLRHANLPHRDDTLSNPPRSLSVGPDRAVSFPSFSSTTAASTTGDDIAQPQLVLGNDSSVGGAKTMLPLPQHTTLLKPTRTLLSPSKAFTTSEAPGASRPLGDLLEEDAAAAHANGHEERGGEEVAGNVAHAEEDGRAGSSRASSPVRGAFPRNGHGNGFSNTHSGGRYIAAAPLVPSMTGTRYGVALGGAPLIPNMTGRQWGGGVGGTPKCPKCIKAVYFAEQVKAVGKTWHKGCLKCSECGHTLDTGRVVDREGEPFCMRCYGKKFGPQGSGYALLGKAGG